MQQRALPLSAGHGTGGHQPVERVAHRPEVCDPAVKLGHSLLCQPLGLSCSRITIHDPRPPLMIAPEFGAGRRRPGQARHDPTP